MSGGPAPTKRRLRRRLIVTGALLVSSLGIFLAGTQLAHSSTRQLVVAAAKHNLPISSSTTSTAAGSTPSEPIHNVLFIGASYTAGLGATPRTEGYAYVVGRDPGWTARVDGVSGTGFLNPGPLGGETFADRVVKDPIHPHPDVVVFQGGRNDVAYSSDKLRAAAIATAELTHKRFIGAQVVFLGPIPAHVPAPADQLAVASTLRSAAAASKSVFIDPIEQGWITADNQEAYVGHVAGHPDNDGYAYIAGHVLTDLKALFPQHGTA
jgi:hypothetical protein